MPLVDYGSSGESGDEENEVQEIKKEEKSQTASDKKNTVKEEVDETVEDPTIFKSLPKPRGQMTLHGNVDSLQNLLLNNKSLKSDGNNKKGHVKIAIPALSNFENDDAPKPQPKKMKCNKQAGLFSVLPPPKNISVKDTKRQLIPHVLKNQLSKQKAEAIENSKLKLEPRTVGQVNSGIDYDDDDDNDSAATTSYFGEGVSNLNTNTTVDFTAESSSVPPVPENNSAYIQPSDYSADERTISYPQYYYQNNGSGIVDQQVSEYDNLPVNNEPLELDDKALQILCGGKRKRNQMPVNIIDLSGEEIMPDSKQWLLKQLTEEQKTRTPGQRKTGGPSVQSRRKHQITYLAFQAKAQELELQNQWSNNRMSRRQTQSKYGF